MKSEFDSKTVLMIEDEHSVRAIVAIYLENAGFKVLEAADADEATSVWHQQMGMIDVVLSDVLLGNVNATEVLGKFREERPDLKVVLMSGGVPAPQKNYNDEIGRFEFLRKPFTIDELLEAIGLAMGEPFLAR
jgi:DNA-binding NtrC family response regulator